MTRIFRHFSRGRMGWLFLVALMGLGFAAARAFDTRAASGAPAASREFAAAHVAAMRAELARIHRGKVDAASLARIDAMGAGNGMVPAHGALIAASYEEPTRSAIARYLAAPASREAETAKSSPVRLAQAAVPAAAPAPSAPASGERSYVGQRICTACHRQEAANWAHTIHAAVFTLNPRDDIEAKGCEACHGPGSAHVRKPADLSTIISFSHNSLTPVPQQNAQCLSCHQGGPRIFWHGSIHENNKLACSDCHNPMANFSAHGLAARDSINQTCFSCHKVQRAQFNQRSHMPLLEGKLGCTDCHNPHGSTTAPLLKADSVNEVCYGCHAEKRGPFLFEHAPVRENCLNCHNPHGSNFESLLTAPRPMLCQQCHAQSGHPAELLTQGYLAGGPRPDPRLLATSCQTCHVNIHGSNSPSGSRFER